MFEDDEIRLKHILDAAREAVGFTEGHCREDLDTDRKLSEEGGYTVFVPALPVCISEGDTKEEALKNIREAIELYLEPVV